jgi:hypothetical protein
LQRAKIYRPRNRNLINEMKGLTSKQMMALAVDGIRNLSSDLLTVVLNKLPPPCLLRCCCVSKNFLRVVQGDENHAGSILSSISNLDLSARSGGTAKICDKELKRLLSRFPCLESLDLSRCLLHSTTMAEHAVYFSSALLGCTRLTSLNISDAFIAPPSTFGYYLPDSLERIDASGLSDQELDSLWFGIARLPRIRTVRMGRTAGGCDINRAMSAMAKACPALETLDVGLCCEQSGVVFSSIEDLAAGCRALRCLDLSMVPLLPRPPRERIGAGCDCWDGRDTLRGRGRSMLFLARHPATPAPPSHRLRHGER